MEVFGLIVIAYRVNEVTIEVLDHLCTDLCMVAPICEDVEP
ncbi:MAG TPA: hypothetical protein VMM60_06375 [Ilumatobacter sp.]|nr:hypothetical protein [Ilumatobacter sp.]